MALRPRHPKKDIEKAIQYAENYGWNYQPSGRSGHAWGRLLCPLGECQMSIWSTPKSAVIHARQITRKVDQCEH